MKKIAIIFFIMILTLVPTQTKAEKVTGLEVNEPKLFVVVPYLSNDAQDFGLTQSLIRSKVELKLRQNDIKIMNEPSFSHYLAINVDFVGN